MSLALMGLTSGLLEAPVICYIGEISEPKIRTILSATTNLTIEFSAALVYFLGSKMPWRDACVFFATIPVIGALLMIFVSF